MNKYETLLKTWCDRLLQLQLAGCGAPHDGAILCKACTTLHGRADNAIFPLLYVYKLTNDKRYMDAAKALFRWQERLLRADGSVYNDGNNTWKAITVFSAIGYYKTLTHFCTSLDEPFRVEMEQRLHGMADWICDSLTVGYHSNINYYAAAASSLGLCGRYFDDKRYLARSREMADYCMRHFTENGLLMGEGWPHAERSAKGCYPVDMGYNVEESIPCLVEAAEALEDTAMLETLAAHMRKTLTFMLPDGGWDNSFGTRNNKWTYYGSRTSDGCLAALLTLAKVEPMFYEAARRNADLQLALTHDGLLYGGYHYRKLHQPPCSHHTICHAAGLADALLHGLTEDMPRMALPCDTTDVGYTYFPELDTYKLAAGDWSVTVTGYDFHEYNRRSGAIHASGGALSMVYHRKTGPVIAGSTYDYTLIEALNMQLPTDERPHRTLIPRLEYRQDGVAYATCLDPTAAIRARKTDNAIHVTVEVGFAAVGGKREENGPRAVWNYTLCADGLTVEARLLNTADRDICLILPVIDDTARVATDNPHTTEPIYYLSGGFGAKEYTLSPDAEGRFRVQLTI